MKRSPTDAPRVCVHSLINCNRFTPTPPPPVLSHQLTPNLACKRHTLVKSPDKSRFSGLPSAHRGLLTDAVCPHQHGRSDENTVLLDIPDISHGSGLLATVELEQMSHLEVQLHPRAFHTCHQVQQREREERSCSVVFNLGPKHRPLRVDHWVPPRTAAWTLITRAIKILHQRPELVNSGAHRSGCFRLFIYLLMRSSTRQRIQCGYWGGGGGKNSKLDLVPK